MDSQPFQCLILHLTVDLVKEEANITESNSYFLLVVFKLLTFSSVRPVIRGPFITRLAVSEILTLLVHISIN